MIDESCEVPRENLDDGFNPCRRQVVENGELCQYAHMYDVMNERYDREEDTSYLNSVKRDRISQSTPSQNTGGGKIYSQDTNGIEGFISTSAILEPTTNAEIPSSKAVADYVAGAIADYAPIPLPISKGGTGGNTPYVTDDLDNSAIFVMHDAPNDRYDAAPMSALTGYLDTQYLPVNNILIPPSSDLNEYKTPGKYAVATSSVVPSILNTPTNLDEAFNICVSPVLTDTYYIGQQLTTYDGTSSYYRFYDGHNSQWTPWTLLYPTPNPLPVDQGGTGAQSRNSVAVSASQGIPLLTNGGPDGPINSWTTVEAMGFFFNRTVVNPQIDNAFTTHTATTVADNNLLPTNALMIDYVAAHAMATPPDKFSYAVSPFPTDTWEGEMNVNVVPVFSVNIGAVTYVIARVYGSKKFNYTGTADNINLFSSLKPVGDYTSIFSGSTDIPLTLSVSGRSYTAGTYGLTPNVSGSNLSLNNQIVSSVFNLGNFNISTNLKCVFGEGTNTPGVTVGVNCMALMWHSVS